MVCTTRSGRVEFKAFLPQAHSVALVGDFTNWKAAPIAMRREGRGWWIAELDLPPGEHTFCYHVDESIYLADYAAHGVRLLHAGEWASSVRVEGAASKIVTTPAATSTIATAA
ncbi:hypothetical protein BH11PLA1_BH11PLA1_14710 [soil metagenome]